MQGYGGVLAVPITKGAESFVVSLGILVIGSRCVLREVTPFVGKNWSLLCNVI